jgi:thiol-disulfide isomerase/thioredoxin
MKRNNNGKVILIIVALIVVGSLGYWYYDQQKPGMYNTFAKCLGEKGAKFYGAFWCPHCQAQKSLFGKSKEYLPYIECSTADQKGQTQICIDENITSYPTWKFTTASGTEVVSGEQTLAQLSEKTGCAIDEQVK